MRLIFLFKNGLLFFPSVIFPNHTHTHLFFCSHTLTLPAPLVCSPFVCSVVLFISSKLQKKTTILFFSAADGLCVKEACCKCWRLLKLLKHTTHIFIFTLDCGIVGIFLFCSSGPLTVVLCILLNCCCNTSRDLSSPHGQRYGCLCCWAKAKGTQTYINKERYAKHKKLVLWNETGELWVNCTIPILPVLILGFWFVITQSYRDRVTKMLQIFTFVPACNRFCFLYRWNLVRLKMCSSASSSICLVPFTVLPQQEL